MTRKELEETNKAYFGNTMEDVKIELGKYLTRVWSAINYINKFKEKNINDEKQFNALEELNNIELILEGEKNGKD